MIRQASLCFFNRMLGAIALTALLSSPVLAQQNDTASRLNRLENEIQTLSRAVFRGEEPPAGFFEKQAASDQAGKTAIANMEVRLTQMETQIRQMTGQVEEFNHKIQQLQNQIQAQNEAMRNMSAQPAQNNMAPYGGQQGYAPSVTPPLATQGLTQPIPQPAQGTVPPPNVQGIYASPIPDPTGAPGLPVTGATPQGAAANTPGNTLGSIASNGNVQQNPTYMYDTAFSMLQQGDYENAQNALQGFINSYPDHPLVSNAQYWIGESLYIRNNFQEAAKAFATGYQKYPQSPKAPDNLLKLALSLSNLGQNEEACLTMGQLKTQYPKAAPAILKKADEESARLKCAPATP